MICAAAIVFRAFYPGILCALCLFVPGCRFQYRRWNVYQLTLNVQRHDRETCTFRPLPRPAGKLSLNVCTPCEYRFRLLPASDRPLSKSGPRPAPKDWEYIPGQNGSSQSAALAQAWKRQLPGAWQRGHCYSKFRLFSPPVGSSSSWSGRNFLFLAEVPL